MTTTMKKVKKIKPLLFPDRAQFKTVLAIDQSYDICGVSLFRDGKLVWVDKIDFGEFQKSNKATYKYQKDFRKKHKRKLLANYVLAFCKYEQVDIVVVERARLRRGGVIAPSTFVTMSELTAIIIDAIPDEVPTVSIDTRAMRKKSTGVANGDKQIVIDWCNENMMTPEIIKERDGKPLNSDEADSIAIGVAFIKGVAVEVEE